MPPLFVEAVPKGWPLFFVQNSQVKSARIYWRKCPEQEFWTKKEPAAGIAANGNERSSGKKTKKSGKVVFKAYNQAQMQLLPQDFDEFVDQNHAARAVDRMIEAVPLEKLERIYAGGGTSSHHPKMLLKVLVYAYSDGIRSSRRIAKSLRENII